LLDILAFFPENLLIVYKGGPQKNHIAYKNKQMDEFQRFAKSVVWDDESKKFTVS
jgi:hypothetical protein